jgi:hypothetical protein
MARGSIAPISSRCYRSSIFGVRSTVIGTNTATVILSK